MSSLATSQPFKALYLLCALILEVCRFPLWVLMYAFPAGRQHRGFTFLQAMGVRIIRAYLQHVTVIELKTSLPLSGRWEGKRFVVMQPAASKYYVGDVEDKKIKPTVIGGTWYPEAYNPATAKPDVEEVVLHFHGGAFVIGDGREFDAGYVCRALVKHLGVKRAFAPQYRLACNANSKFPAPVQDAITAYSYLIHTLRIPADRIILSGDSAGGNLVFALLRYIAEYGAQVGLPTPAAGLLWSPWVQLEPAKDPATILTSANYVCDYLPPHFGAWGARVYTEGLDANQPYLSPLLHPFKTQCPIFIQTGEAEVLYEDNVDLYKRYSDVPGNKVGFHAERFAPHDIALLGAKLSFRTEFAGIVAKAKAFLKENGAL